MTATTRASRVEKQKKDFEHVFSNIMELTQDNNLVKALLQQGCHSIDDVLSLKENQIFALEYVNEKTGKSTPVLLFRKSKLRILKAFGNSILRITMEISIGLMI